MPGTCNFIIIPHLGLLCDVQWAERRLEDGGSEQWGDKWDERFKDGSGSKTVCSQLLLFAHASRPHAKWAMASTNQSGQMNSQLLVCTCHSRRGFMAGRDMERGS